MAESGVSQRQRGDTVLLVCALITVFFSLLMVYSTSGVRSQIELGDSWYYVKRQGIAVLLGGVILFALMQIPTKWLRKVSPYMIIPAVLVLLLPLAPGLGRTVKGATRWVQFGPLRFQPSELAKLCYVLFIAGYFARHERRLERFSHGILRPFAYTGLLSALLLLQPDFGSSAIIAVVTLGMALASGVMMRHVALSCGGLAAAATLLIVQSPYRLTRVVTFLDPFKDRFGKGYQLSQSLIAVGTGRLQGKGFGNSTQKLQFLPDAHTDFIFAVIAEELGFAGCVAVILMFLVVLWRGIRVAQRHITDTFSFTLCVGLTLLIVVPAFINMGVVTGMLPTKGLPLPLVGYGGSSMVVSLSIIGLLLAMSRNREHI